jgi:hypothetical protein
VQKTPRITIAAIASGVSDSVGGATAAAGVSTSAAIARAPAISAIGSTLARLRLSTIGPAA